MSANSKAQTYFTPFLTTLFNFVLIIASKIISYQNIKQILIILTVLAQNVTGSGGYRDSLAPGLNSSEKMASY